MQTAAQFKSVAVRQHHVQHHDIERLLPEQLPHTRRVLGRAHVEQMTAQIDGQRVADLAVIIHDKNARSRTKLRSSAHHDVPAAQPGMILIEWRDLIPFVAGESPHGEKPLLRTADSRCVSIFLH
ncbi:hypothetical protein ALO84_102226 [Pseudomonas syringae pv. maculicola]|nr:Unknown protein sequence [Pseudomonas syringae pv. maculicola str. M6]KPX72366.1 hypothetical protein ALO84_102226 [Pseudomonas syringae pv. maculicola]RMP35102.1 hypothetical protein ALQ23_102451 [Pseudomonas syringae pv. antirrhini]